MIMAHSESCQCCSSISSSVAQTVTEMDFERGIWFAAVNGETERVAKFLNSGLNPNVVDSSSQTALHYAARHNHIAVCKLLLSRGANVNLQTESGRLTALHKAAYSGHTSVVQLLLEFGADPSLSDADGLTPLHKACEGGHSDTIKMLCNVNSNLKRSIDSRQRTPRDCLSVLFNDIESKALLSLDEDLAT